ncbi:DUF983 domain-containing protein [Lutibaculum baratangense]|uniref:Zinc finger protein n=1 Tax=Lutibaculum baratangense AMV1 TaxID=631454 RepID=V4RBR4_9HYPH|nr:DUF983 domain-containing protein [Lutibaculum baratangense]ESR23596.1 Zinc finger protein [Lutibaculum baratangense AMV1]
MTDKPITWQRDADELPLRKLAPAMRRGMKGRCPSCGEGKLFRSYLKTVDACAHCGEEIHHHRADDAPPYFTIAIVAHIVVPLLLIVERGWAPDLWIHSAIFLPMTILLCLLFLPPVKGALIGLQWAYYMHGFDPRSGGAEDWDGVGFVSWTPPR